MPRLSVVLPVYNGEAYIEDAIRSVLTQTFADLELIVVDDGSRDRTSEVVSSIDDGRLRYVKNETNQGIWFALNRGLDLSDSEYIGRMDQDDISLPQRFETQIAFANSHKNVACSGSWMQAFGRGKSHVMRLPLFHESLTALSCFDSPLFHPTVLIRRQLLKSHSLRYTDEALVAEDYDLWERVSHYAELANVGQALLRYRIHGGQVSAQRKSQQDQSADMIRCRVMQRLGLLDNDDMPTFNRFCRLPARVSRPDLEEFHQVASKALSRITTRGSLFAQEFCRNIVERWIYSCVRCEEGLTASRFLAKGIGAIGPGRILESLLNSYRLRRGGIRQLLIDRMPRA